MTQSPYLFDEFFASNREESVSPFLTPSSRKWAKNLSLKMASIAAFLLLLSFLALFLPPLSSLLLLCVYCIVGVPALLSTLEDLRNFEITIDSLMTLAAFASLFIGSGLEGGLLLVLFELSHSMEENVSKKTVSALRHLNAIAPKKAQMIDTEGNVFEKSVHDIALGEIIQVKQGDIIPLDGKIIKGSSSLNLAHLTGESIPSPKTVGDTVPAGARNLDALLLIEVTSLNQDSTLTKIMHLISSAQEAKPRLQSLLDRFGEKYASIIMILTFLFGLVLPFLFSISYFGPEGSIYRALAFLIAASPCALIIATPTAYLSALSACAKRGILLKGGIILDALAQCKSIAFDKTGTITTGELSCLSITPLQSSSFGEKDILSIVYGLEQNVSHPIAKALCKMAQIKQILPAEITSFQAKPGLGVEGVYQNIPVKMGLPSFVLPKDPEKHVLEKIDRSKEEGKVISLLSIDQDLFIFEFADQIRKEASLLMQNLKKNHWIHPVMLTGDHEKSAHHVGKAVGITDIFHELRPEDKLAKITELSQHRPLAMVGDGINDAPSLARAHVGISMGKIGSGAAIDASDVVLLNDDLHLVSWLFSKAHRTKQIVRQNLGLALGVILFATVPALLGMIPLWLAVLLHEGGTVIVGLNSLRLLRFHD